MSNTPVTFGSAVSSGFSKYFNFSERASRAEFWYFQLFLALLGLGTWALDVMFDPKWANADLYSPINTMVSVLTFIPSLSVTARRLHDTNRSGWLMLIAIIPLFAMAFMMGTARTEGQVEVFALVGLIVFAIAAIALIIWLVSDGTPGPNQYGEDPKGRYPAGSGFAA